MTHPPPTDTAAACLPSLRSPLPLHAPGVHRLYFCVPDSHCPSPCPLTVSPQAPPPSLTPQASHLSLRCSFCSDPFLLPGPPCHTGSITYSHRLSTPPTHALLPLLASPFLIFPLVITANPLSLLDVHSALTHSSFLGRHATPALPPLPTDSPHPSLTLFSLCCSPPSSSSLSSSWPTLRIVFHSCL